MQTIQENDKICSSQKVAFHPWLSRWKRNAKMLFWKVLQWIKLVCLGMTMHFWHLKSLTLSFLWWNLFFYPFTDIPNIRKTILRCSLYGCFIRFRLIHEIILWIDRIQRFELEHNLFKNVCKESLFCDKRRFKRCHTDKKEESNIDTLLIYCTNDFDAHKWFWQFICHKKSTPF